MYAILNKESVNKSTNFIKNEKINEVKKKSTT